MITNYILPFLLAADFPVCQHTPFQYYPSVVFAESTYYAFWSDLTFGGSIFSARVQPDGTVLDTDGRFLYHGVTTHGVKAAFDGENFLAVFRDSC
jgi:hypothetical protein